MPQYDDLPTGAEVVAHGPMGLRTPGNINLNGRPILHNPDGRPSTEISFSRGTDKGEVLVPQIVNGKKLSQDEAWQHYVNTGEHMGIFDSPANADVYAQRVHNRQLTSSSSPMYTLTTPASSYSDLPPGAQIVPQAAAASVRPQTVEELNNTLQRQFVSDQYDTAKSSLKQAGEGALDTFKGMIQSVIPKSATDVAIGPGGMIGRALIKQGIDLAKMVPEVPGAIKDISNSPNPMGEIAKVSPYAGGQGAAQLLLAKGMEAAVKAPATLEPAQAMNLIRKGVLPKDPDFMPTLAKNLDTLKAAPEISGKAQMAAFLEKSGTAHRQLYEQLLKPNESATVQLSGDRTIKNYGGELVQDPFGRNLYNTVTLRQLDSRLNIINNTIRDAKSGVNGGPLSTEGIAPLKAEASAIRKVLYPELQKLTGVDPAPIHAKMGQLNDLARSVRESEIARYNQVNRPIDAPTTTKAGLIARGAGKVQRKVFGDPQDVAIRKAFEGLRRR